MAVEYARSDDDYSDVRPLNEVVCDFYNSATFTSAEFNADCGVSEIRALFRIEATLNAHSGWGATVRPIVLKPNNGAPTYFCEDENGLTPATGRDPIIGGLSYISSTWRQAKIKCDFWIDDNGRVHFVSECVRAHTAGQFQIQRHVGCAESLLGARVTSFHLSTTGGVSFDINSIVRIARVF